MPLRGNTGPASRRPPRWVILRRAGAEKDTDSRLQRDDLRVPLRQAQRLRHVQVKVQVQGHACAKRRRQPVGLVLD